MTLKQNTEFKKRFDEYIEKHSRKTEKNKIKTFMKQIRHGLARGADKKTIFNFFRDEKILTLSYNSFCRYLRELEHEDNIQVEHKDHSNVTETTQESPNKSPQQTPKTTQSVDPKAKEQTSFENREFGKLPAGKVWKDLTDDEKEIIRKEREELQGQENRRRLAENIEANRKAREEAEKNKFRHDPNPKPPGYWEKQQDTQETEEREFGKLPTGKVWSELSEELKETIRSERRQLDAEAREKRKQQQIEAAVAEREASKLHHNPNT